jgi:uncharacterized protein YndB with AHSA1/START domain
MPFMKILAAVALAAGAPALAEVSASTETGFATHSEVVVAATPAQVWAEMTKPAGWWNAEHSYSGNAANMHLDPVAGGCFCEVIPTSAGEPAGQVEHMRVLYVAPYSTLRLSGGLGPLQAEAVTGVLTMTLKPEGAMTRISWDYVVGGYMRMKMAEMAPVVDGVVGEQLLRLAAQLGKVMDPVGRRLR